MTPVFLPQNLEELWRLLDSEPDALVYAGGTDLLVQIRYDDVPVPPLICLERIGEIRGIRREGDLIRIGAASTHAELLLDPDIPAYLPVLASALKTLGSPPIRNMGTIGGNVCTASPAGDTLPALYVLDAEVTLLTKNGTRRMALRDFICGPGETVLAKGEIVATVDVPIAEGFSIHHFEKVGQRKSLACAIASMAALIRLSPSGIVEEARLAWGSVAPTVFRSPLVEAALIGKPLAQMVLEEAAAQVREAVSPIDDVRASAAYRRKVAGNLVLRLLSGNAPSMGA